VGLVECAREQRATDFEPGSAQWAVRASVRGVVILNELKRRGESAPGLNK
jgi:hypothetical protein